MMGPRSRGWGVLGVALFAVACGKGSAEQALVAASAAVEQARPEIEQYVPAELKEITDGLRAAKTSFERGDYKRTLASAQALVPKVQAAADAASQKKDELVTTFADLKASVPGRVDSLKRRLTQLAAATKLPSDLDQETVQTAQANLGSLSAVWTDAIARFDSGDVVGAVTKATDVKAKVEEMAKVFLPASRQ
jgi:ABC-type transporter Mla subunit MlaD